jgi:hypothetical protein
MITLFENSITYEWQYFSDQRDKVDRALVEMTQRLNNLELDIKSGFKFCKRNKDKMRDQQEAEGIKKAHQTLYSSTKQHFEDQQMKMEKAGYGIYIDKEFLPEIVQHEAVYVTETFYSNLDRLDEYDTSTCLGLSPGSSDNFYTLGMWKHNQSLLQQRSDMRTSFLEAMQYLIVNPTEKLRKMED